MPIKTGRHQQLRSHRILSWARQVGRSDLAAGSLSTLAVLRMHRDRHDVSHHRIARPSGRRHRQPPPVDPQVAATWRPARRRPSSVPRSRAAGASQRRHARTGGRPGHRRALCRRDHDHRDGDHQLQPTPDRRGRSTPTWMIQGTECPSVTGRGRLRRKPRFPSGLSRARDHPLNDQGPTAVRRGTTSLLLA